jgi:hypothetical protein
MRLIISAAVLCIALIEPAAAEPRDGRAVAPDRTSPVVRDLFLPSGEQQRVLYAAPDRPRAAVVMLPGGTGDIGIDPDGTMAHGDNFVVRSRHFWLERGFAVLIPDAPDGVNLRGHRASAGYAAVVARLVEFARAEAKAPVFLLGTSQGSIATMNGASVLGPGQIAGIVLTESVSRAGRKSDETVFDAHPELVGVPALVVANRDDACPVAPPQDASRIAAAMVHSGDVRSVEVEGGSTVSDDCGSLSPHGYYGIEDRVVAIVAGWMADHGVRRIQ